MSSFDRGVSVAETQGTRSSALPSHPVEINDSDMEEASRSVSPEPLTQKKVAAKHEPSEGTSTYWGMFAACLCIVKHKQYLLGLQVLCPRHTPSRAVVAILKATHLMAYHQF